MRGGKDNERKVIAGIALVAALTTLSVGVAVSHMHLALFTPRGTVAHQERGLIFFALGLSLVVVLPVFAMLFGIVWKYREGNTQARYQPNWGGSRRYEAAWWLIPTALIIILSVVTWQSSHTLDPARALAATKPPLTIQVVALQWKWLFIYPEQHIASVNFVELPVETPVQFEITSDGPMNSFWIPQLGGQIYAMSGMSTHINLMADMAGDYRGSSANISGEGFSGMQFTARAATDNDFAAWVDSVHESPNHLDAATYHDLAEPSLHNPQTFYASVDANLYTEEMMQFMDPAHRTTSSDEHEHMHRDYGVNR